MDYNEFEEDDFDKGLPERTDSIYSKIECFKDYELTHCIGMTLIGPAIVALSVTLLRMSHYMKTTV